MYLKEGGLFEGGGRSFFLVNGMNGRKFSTGGWEREALICGNGGIKVLQMERVCCFQRRQRRFPDRCCYLEINPSGSKTSIAQMFPVRRSEEAGGEK